MIDLNFDIDGGIILCHPDGSFATAEEVAIPSYVPCIQIRLKKPFKPIKFGNGIYSPYVPLYKTPTVLGIGISSKGVGTVSRKLKSKWTMKSSSDLRFPWPRKNNWTLVYNYRNGCLYDLRRDRKLIRIKIKKRRLNTFLQKVLVLEFKIFVKFGIADFTKFTMPIIRKSYPKLINKSLIGIQPMIAPLNPKYYSMGTVTNL